MKTRFSVLWILVLASALSLGALPIGAGRHTTSSESKEKETARPWLGVYLRDVTPKFAEKEHLSAKEGAYVNQVQEKSPADSAGIQKGDIIVEFNGRQIYDSDDLVKAVRRSEAGTKAKVVCIRGSERKEMFVLLKEYPRRRVFSFSFPKSSGHRMLIFKGKGTIGLSLMELNPQLAKYFEAPEDAGVLVERVEKGSIAEKAGFKAGDVIVKIGDRRIDDIRDIRRKLSTYKEGEIASVDIIRKGAKMTLSLQIEKGEAPEEWGYSFGNFLPPPAVEDFDIEVTPDEEEMFEFEVPDIRPQMEKLRLELEKMREKMINQKEQIQKQIREEWKAVKFGLDA
jgi:serine protease Do